MAIKVNLKIENVYLTNVEVLPWGTSEPFVWWRSFYTDTTLNSIFCDARSGLWDLIPVVNCSNSTLKKYLLTTDQSSSQRGNRLSIQRHFMLNFSGQSGMRRVSLEVFWISPSDTIRCFIDLCATSASKYASILVLCWGFCISPLTWSLLVWALCKVIKFRYYSSRHHIGCFKATEGISLPLPLGSKSTGQRW